MNLALSYGALVSSNLKALSRGKVCSMLVKCLRQCLTILLISSENPLKRDSIGSTRLRFFTAANKMQDRQNIESLDSSYLSIFRQRSWNYSEVKIRSEV